MCGGTMRLDLKERIERIPGAGPAKSRKIREWVCPECDYFEEAEDEESLG